ncbi:MAG: EAL domain-containing protein [Epsilonproteobacteria bacterium]|nr:EAL domain-containing protein [Campylobacterota bacterium]
MREKIKKQLLHNLLLEVSKRYEYIMAQNARIFEETNYKAIHDELTGLYNRFYFIEQLKKSLLSAERHKKYGAVLFIDLDNFKVINDATGHKAGDLLLKMIAKKLKSALREEDVLARFGGDEFVVLVENLGRDENRAVEILRGLADKLLASIGYGHIVDQKVYQVTASIGIALFNDATQDIDDILRYADSAMYEAKRKGKSQTIFFNPLIEERLQRRFVMETSIRQGIDEEEFFLVYQPQVEDGRVVGAEALIRWNNAEKGIIPPGEFIEFAEETRMIIPIGEWALHEACKTLKRWEKDPALKGLKLSINCSAIEFMEPGFDQKVMRILTHYGIGTGRLCFEITESLLMTHHASLTSVMRRLSDFGVKIALDDFGTGYSSLAYLKNFPIDILKIDRSFIEDIFFDRSDQTLVRAIVSVAEDFGMQVVAEGVESPEQEMTIHTIADHIIVQGYLYGKPLPLEAFEAAVKESV